jgi:hypothetical protein
VQAVLDLLDLGVFRVRVDQQMVVHSAAVERQLPVTTELGTYRIPVVL